MKSLAPTLALALVLAAGACGSDAEPSDQAATEVTEPTTTTTVGPATDEPDAATTETTRATVAETTEAAPAGDSALCQAFARLREADDAVGAKVNDAMAAAMAGASPEQTAAEARRIMGEIDRGLVDDVYRQLAAVAPEAIAGDVATLHQGTIDILDALVDVDITDESAMAAALDTEAVMETARATLAVDRVSRDECDIVIAD